MIYIVILTLITLYFIGLYIDKCNEKTNIFTQMKEYEIERGDEVVYVGESDKFLGLYHGEIYRMKKESGEVITVYDNNINGCIISTHSFKFNKLDK